MITNILPHSNPCGHTCCAQCLATWFRSELSLKLKEYRLLPLRVRNQDPPRTLSEGIKLRRLLTKEMARNVFSYSCPLCRAKIVAQPQVADISKGVVACFEATIQPYLPSPVEGSEGTASLFAGLFPGVVHPPPTSLVL